MKTCSKCKIKKPFEAFYKNKKSRDGHKSECKECEKLRRLELKKNPLMQLEKQIISSIMLENKLLKRENKKICSGCKEIFLIEDLSDGFYCKVCNRKKSEKHYEKNKECILENLKEYRGKNKEKIKEYKREYHLKKKLEKLQNNDLNLSN